MNAVSLQVLYGGLKTVTSDGSSFIKVFELLCILAGSVFVEHETKTVAILIGLHQPDF